MEKVDFVLVGSEAVVESGGLINAVGSNQIAIIARAANKPFYALAERLVVPMLKSVKVTDTQTLHQLQISPFVSSFTVRLAKSQLENPVFSSSFPS